MLEINQSRPAHWCNPKKHASKQLLGKTLQNPTTLIFEGKPSYSQTDKDSSVEPLAFCNDDFMSFFGSKKYYRELEYSITDASSVT